MNYRHAFHAGNFADVHKHAVLAWILTYLRGKPAAFRVIDTHAGAGRYDLFSRDACRSGEWRDGIGRGLETARPCAGRHTRFWRPISMLLPRLIPAASCASIRARR